MGNVKKGPHHPHTVTAEILPFEFGNKTVLAPVLEGLDEYITNELRSMRKHFPNSDEDRVIRFMDFAQCWDGYQARDIWVWVNGDQTCALRLVIEPVSKDDAHHIRRQYGKLWKVKRSLPKPDYMGRGIHCDDAVAEKLRQVVQGIADRIADVNVKSEQDYRNSFVRALLDLPDHFAEVDGEIVQLETDRGFGGGCMQYLKPLDVALLKCVWRRLPLRYQLLRKPLPMKIDLAAGERCPCCGGVKRERTSYKKPAKLRKELAESLKEYPQDVFDEWVKIRLRSRPGDFTYTRKLYADYVACVQKGGIIVSERPVMRETMLTRDKWGRLMGVRYQNGKRNGRKGYKSVALKGTRRRS